MLTKYFDADGQVVVLGHASPLLWFQERPLDFGHTDAQLAQQSKVTLLILKQPAASLDS
jgi:hypothetical protein